MMGFRLPRGGIAVPVCLQIPVENARAGEEEEEDPTFCEVCGRSDREDRLLLCDGCDAG